MLFKRERKTQGDGDYAGDGFEEALKLHTQRFRIQRLAVLGFRSDRRAWQAE